MVWDVAVAGSGPAGAAAAIVLAGAGRSVLLLEASNPPARKVGESLPGGARPLLRRLGALEALVAGPHRESRGVWSVWGRDEPAVSHDPVRSPHGPGWHLDRPRFDHDLRRRAVEAGADLRAGRLRSLERIPWRGGEEVWALSIDGEEVWARWLLDATGRSAALARRLGAERRRDDDLVAVVGWIRAMDEDRRTWVEAVPDGWWYTAPVPGGERVLVLHAAAAEAAPLRHHPELWAERLAATRWIRRLAEEAIAHPTTALLTHLRATEAAGGRLDRFTDQAWLAAGDTALSFDPISSQGILNALYTGTLAGEALDAVLAGNPTPLTDYPQRLERVRTAYLRHHRDAYRAEARWPDRPFWKRRHG